MWIWGRIERVKWTDRIRKEAVLERVDEVETDQKEEKELADAAPYMIKASKYLKLNFPNMIHVTCLAHTYHRTAEVIRRQFPGVDELIGAVKRYVKCIIWAERWTLRRSEENRIEAFEMWLWRRMERVKWTDRIRNETVLERVDEERMKLKLIRKRKRNWLGHWLRRNCLLKDTLEGMVNGKRVWGRRRHQRLEYDSSVDAGGYALFLFLHDGEYYDALLTRYPFQRVLTITDLEQAKETCRLYFEDLLNNCLEHGKVTVGGRRIKLIRLVDYTALLGAEEMILRDMLMELNDICEQYEMKINSSKMKTMIAEFLTFPRKHHSDPSTPAPRAIMSPREEPKLLISTELAPTSQLHNLPNTVIEEGLGASSYRTYQRFSPNEKRMPDGASFCDGFQGGCADGYPACSLAGSRVGYGNGCCLTELTLFTVQIGKSSAVLSVANTHGQKETKPLGATGVVQSAKRLPADPELRSGRGFDSRLR
ncbi:hypothetical protein ANN_02979 [Periplaneta americana]|uniref:DUF659 domain-containing protein n=1 Tax=Periplaneta americana TaxID=6978 RepID=A0ABQ8U2H8_PERAM|nr:hypothetical protein ANN_02979 [Periplaneta americana]